MLCSNVFCFHNFVMHLNIEHTHFCQLWKIEAISRIFGILANPIHFLSKYLRVVGEPKRKLRRFPMHFDIFPPTIMSRKYSLFLSIFCRKNLTKWSGFEISRYLGVTFCKKRANSIFNLIVIFINDFLIKLISRKCIRSKILLHRVPSVRFAIINFPRALCTKNNIMPRLITRKKRETEALKFL